MREPHLVVLSEHARDKAAELHRPPGEIADVVLDGHPGRQRNPGAADWIVAGTGLEVVYNWPDKADATRARIVSLWLQR